LQLAKREANHGAVITSRARSWGWLALVVLALPLGCREPGPRALLTIRVDQAIYRPDHALLTWRSPSGQERRDVRVPRSGELPRIGAELATVYVDLDPSQPGEREVVVRGMRGDRQVSAGSARLSWQPGQQVEATITLGCFQGPATPGEGVCPPAVPAPDAGADAPPSSDGLALDGESPADAGADAGAPDATPRADAGPVLEDAGPVLDLPVEVRPPPPDAADPPDVAIVAIDGPDPVDAMTPPPVDVDLTTGLVLYFKLDDDVSSGTAADSSGNANLGLLSNLEPGQARVPGHSGQGIELPGGEAPGWISVQSSPSLNLVSHELTISVWLRASPAPGGGRSTIVARAASAGGVLYSLHLLGDRPALWLNSSQGARGMAISATRLRRDQWVHLALVYDGMRARLHADGRVVAEAAHELGFAPEITPLTIGGRPGGAVPAIDTFAGRLDEIAVYDRALTPAEVQALADGLQPAVP
jgi:hypothetical protein